jgi:exodeoxyribonuclease V beta subunit
MRNPSTKPLAPGPLALRLSGLHLIEASAGTGKTYTIAHLVLRLLVESGLGIQQILVLTFTDAATQELKDRIARRLRQASAVLGGEPGNDRVLADWVGALPDPQLARARLDLALADLDRCAIHTIHGFCQRLLRDFAFESGAPFDAELVTDAQGLRLTVAQDWWRRRLSGADRAETAWLLANLPNGPDSVLKLLGPWLGGAAPEPLVPDRARVESDLAQLQGLHATLCAAWPGAREEVQGLLGRQSALKANVYSAGAIAKAIAAMDSLLARPLGDALPEKLELLGTTKLEQSVKKGCVAPEHPFFGLCDGLLAFDSAGLARARRALLLADALDYLRFELVRRKAQTRTVHFDDLLTQSAAALAGPRGPALAERVRTAWPQALIDEFQDTDALQYRIFDRVYSEAIKRDGRLGLYLIGDPKQAIYGFRGADIFAYIAAARQAGRDGQVHSLDTNRRSASRLVGAINRLFGRAKAPFVFEGDIDFEPVLPGPEADKEPLSIAGETPPPVQLRWLSLNADNADKNGRRIRAEPAREQAAADCAGEIAALLRAPARIGEAPLRAADIAVLVRSHRDGSLVRDALAGLGIGSVSIGRETVFGSEEAEDLAALLEALRPGAPDGTLRTALATRLLGWTAAELAGLAADEGTWGRVLADFQGYRETWQRHGLMAALERLLHGRDIPARLRRGPGGERRLTNLLHLAELAQEAARDHPGPEGLARWLAERRADPQDSGDAALLRLESDENLVQVVTFHKCKGLEYPVVFIPMPWSGNQGLDKGAPLVFHERGSLGARLDLGSADYDAHRALWEEEDLAERLRLLYVALTRARHRCVVHWGAVNQAECSGLAYLLHQGPEGEPAAERMKGLDGAALRADLESLVALAPDCIALADPPRRGAPPLPLPAGAEVPLGPAVFAGRVPDDWRILSFSGLAGAAEPERPDHDALAADLKPEAEPGLERPTGVEPALVPAGPEPQAEPMDPVFRFPRGIRAGHCLHDLLENLDFRHAQGPALRQAAESALARHGLDPQWTGTLVDLVGRVLDSPLDASGLRLRGVGPEDRRNELEFHFAVDRLDPQSLRALLLAQGIPIGPGLGRSPLDGLMKGYMDLVLRVPTADGGRFYIIDYKSNHLGDRIEDYGPQGLARAMDLHGYRLQYLIYTVALHRWLKTRLPGYDSGRHLGGAIYLFLRGMRPGLGPAYGIYRDRPDQALVESLDLAFGAAESAIRGSNDQGDTP